MAITGSSMVSCLGDLDATFDALVAGRSGASPLRLGDPAKLNVTHGYSIDADTERSYRAGAVKSAVGVASTHSAAGAAGTAGTVSTVSTADACDADGAYGIGEDVRLAGRWVATAIAKALAESGVDPDTSRVSVIVGTGLRELRAVEQWHGDAAALRLAQLHFNEAVRSVAPGVTEVHTLANACAASGYALALAADLLDLGEADAVVVAGCDTMTESMLTMIGRVGTTTAETVRPFDADRDGVLLGEGAVAVVLELPTDKPAFGLIRGVGIGCDAYHETAPDPDGIVATMHDAHQRAGIAPGDIDLIVAHGTATALNDPTEATALHQVFGGLPADQAPAVTAIKGAIGHTSGGAALMSVLVACQTMRTGTVPPVTGLRTAIAEAEKLAMVCGAPLAIRPRLAQINAFGFGGVNAVTIVEAVDA
ncbi:beta-ketoacyl synthase N-terminal-like domain-containing protein [Streptomyces zagrosensis]|uniref:3-oxoacyl-[acyl-carrier-protein] synthase II n=1 Tax=Streptomyces zagrosensis TaxID=1042984 RepID=A0A7W9QH48_9ACTN|nr:beta-ketoacyl synthase N-terminal-like domain-containing protein [Streptomyces zagrosensis]MBB5940163.1 3-oxoacyl-[acyl-carrier-protein] synthase II [Streptomyces zagrosensis]